MILKAFQLVMVAEDLSGNLRRLVEISGDGFVHGKENHAHAVTHVGGAAGAPPTIRQAVTGVPGVVPIGHLQKITGVNGQHTGFGDVDGVEGIRQPGEYGVIGANCLRHCVAVFVCIDFFLGEPVQPKAEAQLIDDPAGLLSCGAGDPAVLGDKRQIPFLRNAAVAGCGGVQGCLKV